MRLHRIIGPFCGAILALGTLSCGKKHGNPDWDSAARSAPSISAKALTTAQRSEIDHSEATNPTPSSPGAAKSEAGKATRKADSDNPGLRFIGYNVENWLTMERMVDHRMVESAPKPESEKKAVIKILATNAPDVIGLCEVGKAGDLAEIQELLKSAGLDLPHSYYTGGADPVRHLGLLSRYPITATAKPMELEYQMKGRTFGFNRGILDATISANGKSYRFIGAHLKSKREVEEGDQEEMRLHEAHLLRAHIDSIFQAEPQARLIVYGDLNDTYPSKTVKTVTGSTDDSRRLTPIYLKDSRGEAWTHHWNNQDIYSRIDFITHSSAMKSEINYRACHIIDDPLWIQASDHRPLLAIFK